MKRHLTVLALLSCALPAFADVISWRIDGTATTWAGPRFPLNPDSGDPVFTALPDEPQAWQAFSYDTATATYLSATFDYGTYEAHAVGPITGVLGWGIPAGTAPITGWVRAEWDTSFGTLAERQLWIGGGSNWDDWVLAGSTAVYARFNPTGAAYFVEPAAPAARFAVLAVALEQTVPEPGSLALLALGLLGLAGARFPQVRQVR